MKRQLFTRPDRYFALTGDLRHWVVGVNITGAPAFMKGLRAVFVSDTHVIGRTEDRHLKKLTDSINALKPDILLMGGDYADMRGDAVRLYEALKAVRPPMGKFACKGNNDTEGWEDPGELSAVMQACGIDLLVNESRAVSYNGGTLVIAGVDEHFHGDPQYRELFPEKPSADVYRLLLSHFPCMPKVLPDLMLSGHTHGGQFNAFGITPFTIGFERLLDRRAVSVAVSGLHDMDGAKLLVGKGIGASRFQLRIGVRPEIYDLRFDC